MGNTKTELHHGDGDHFFPWKKKQKQHDMVKQETGCWRTRCGPKLSYIMISIPGMSRHCNFNLAFTNGGTRKMRSPPNAHVIENQQTQTFMYSLSESMYPEADVYCNLQCTHQKTYQKTIWLSQKLAGFHLLKHTLTVPVIETYGHSSVSHRRNGPVWPHRAPEWPGQALWMGGSPEHSDERNPFLACVIDVLFIFFSLLLSILHVLWVHVFVLK